MYRHAARIAISAALAGARSVTAVDVSRRAVLTVRLNARLNGVRVEARASATCSTPCPAARFDVIIANPPYLPAAHDALPARGRARHTEAGATAACCSTG